MRRDQSDRDEVKALLLASIESLVRHLCPEGRRSGAYWLCRSAAHDAKIGGCWVKLTGAPGAWRDEVTGAKGDVFGLIEARAGVTGFAAQLDWARGWLGLAGMGAAERAERRREAEGRVAAAAARPADSEADRRRAQAMFIRSRQMPFVETPAHLYLQRRGIDVRQLGRLPGALGYLPPYERSDGTITWGAMVGLFTAADGRPAAVHRTFLTDEGDKAPVDPVRRIWPAFGGAAIRLWRGGSRLSVEQAAAAGLREPLVLVEGIEDGLSVALAAPEWRVWAVGALGNLAQIRLPECCDEAIVAADNDWGKPQAQRLLDKGLAALASQGATVSVARSLIGKDFNDSLKGVA